MIALAWTCFAMTFVILFSLWYHVQKMQGVTWRHGIYGHKYYLRFKYNVVEHEAARLWLRSISFALLGMLAAAEMGLTAHIRVIDDDKHRILLKHDRYTLVIFTSVWTVASILVHRIFSYFVAAIWAGITAALWLASGVFVTVSSRTYRCTSYIEPELARACEQLDSLWRALIALAWTCFAMTIIILFSLWYHVRKMEGGTWGKGMYGRSHSLRIEYGVEDEEVQQQRPSPATSTSPTEAADGK
ncbi:hypothetical protein P389DRAFT_55365 [Cystobasidium minutum MCA 4210]|uniref:uncharacterized protein n=1 Tax=Cystobasidium minutum MCA 4210 TaxID=1397322 RepID=UPI0034CD8CA6|eukprot:jgi/Rhomi1/55365/CE55364_36